MDMNILSIVSNNVRTIRRGKNLTQQQLANKAFLSLATIQLLETGERWPEKETVNLICKALEIEDTILFMPYEVKKDKLSEELNFICEARGIIDNNCTFNEIIPRLIVKCKRCKFQWSEIPLYLRRKEVIKKGKYFGLAPALLIVNLLLGVLMRLRNLIGRLRYIIILRIL